MAGLSSTTCQQPSAVNDHVVTQIQQYIYFQFADVADTIATNGYITIRISPSELILNDFFFFQTTEKVLFI